MKKRATQHKTADQHFYQIDDLVTRLDEPNRVFRVVGLGRRCGVKTVDIHSPYSGHARVFESNLRHFHREGSIPFTSARQYFGELVKRVKGA